MNPQLARFFDREAEAAETQASRIRTVVLLLVMARLVLAQGPEMWAGVAKHWMATGVIVLGLLATAAMPRWVRREARKERVLVASSVLDAVLAFLIVGVGVVWPRGGYLGVLAAPDFAVWPIIAASAGLRLSRGAATAGSWAALVGVGTLVALDLAMNRELMGYGAPEIALGLVLMVAAMLVSRGIESRGRRLILEGAERAVLAERTRQRFGAYVPEALVDALLQGEQAAPGDGEVRDVAVLFSDLRGFTAKSEGVDPTSLVEELNGYLEAMVAVVRERGGIVDKYVGDGMLVVFGVPHGTGHDATAALETAIAMDAALADHNAARVANQLEPLRHGIGAHWGRAVAGNVGTADRLQFTVLGDVVNVASRLQEATKVAGVSVLVSEALVDRARGEGSTLPALQPLRAITPRGRKGAVGVLTPVA